MKINKEALDGVEMSMGTLVAVVDPVTRHIHIFTVEGTGPGAGALRRIDSLALSNKMAGSPVQAHAQVITALMKVK